MNIDVVIYLKLSELVKTKAGLTDSTAIQRETESLRELFYCYLGDHYAKNLGSDALDKTPAQLREAINHLAPSRPEIEAVLEQFIHEF